MKKVIVTAIIVLLFAAVLIGCGEKNNAVGTWQDEKELITFTFKNDGTGLLEIYIEMLKSSSKNELVYTCDGDTIQWKFKNSTEEYSTLVIENGAIDYGGASLKKK